MIADARAPFVRPGGRGADEREKGTRRPRIQRARDGPAEKDRPIDPMSGKNSPAKEPEPVSSLWTSGRAPALHAASVSQPLPFDASLPFCPCEANAAAFRRARDNAFHPATDHHP